jgi:hypothetical protein
MNKFFRNLLAGGRGLLFAAVLAVSVNAGAAVQYSVAVNNARLDAIETTVGTTAHLHFYTGSKPTNCAASATGTEVADLTLPSDWMADAASSAKSKSGTWSGTGSASGTIGYFRITNTAGTACGLQGTVTATGGGGDITVDNTSIASGQAISVTSFTLNAGNQ